MLRSFNPSSSLDGGLREYERHKFAIADILRSATAIAPAEKHDWQEQAQDLFVRLAEDRFNLACVGRFSRGKTSLMNAILGTDRLPTGIIPLTSVITAVAYGSKERVILKHDKRILTTEVSIEALPEYITQEGNPGNVQRISSAEVQLPAEILRRGFYFVDTPGLGSAIVQNSRTTEQFLPEADAVLLVTSYESPLSEEEEGVLRAASASAQRVFVVVNKHDMALPAERAAVLDFVRRRLENALDQQRPKFFSVSARDGLKAKQAKDQVCLIASGLPALEDELVDFLLTEKTIQFLLRTCNRVRDLLIDLPPSPDASQLIARIDALSQAIAGDGKENAADKSTLLARRGVPRSDLGKFHSCEICAQAFEQYWNFLRRYQNDLGTSRDEQRAFAEQGGFCSFHTWQYASIASIHGICTSYPVLLNRLAQLLREVHCETERRALLTELQRASASPESCILCRVCAKAETDAIAATASRLAAEWATGRSARAAICVPHLATVVSALGDDDLVCELLDQHATVLERLSDDMERYALKHDAVRRTLASEEEETAAQRALSLVAGHRGVNKHQ